MRSALPFYVAVSEDVATLHQCCVAILKYALDDATATHLAASWIHLAAQQARASGDEEFAAAMIETVVELHSLLVSHSQFMGLLLPEHESEEAGTDDAGNAVATTLSRLHLTELWCVLQEIAPAQCCSAKLLQLMLAAYDGSLSAVDTLLLDGIRRAEPVCGVSLVSDEFAFGRLLRRRLLSDDDDKQLTVVNALTLVDGGLFNANRLRVSVDEFPVTRGILPGATHRLLPAPVVDAGVLRARASHAALIYDPAFVLPLILQLMLTSTKTRVDMRRFTTSALFDYCVASLASARTSTRTVAQRVVQQVFAAVATYPKLHHQRLFQRLLDIARKQAKSARLLSLATAFVSAQLIALRATGHALHKPFMRLFSKQAKLPVNRVPLVNRFLRGDRTQRAFVLRYLASGAVRDAGDVAVLMRHNIVTFLLYFIPSSVGDAVARADAYTVLLALSRVREGAAVMLTFHGVLEWAVSMLHTYVAVDTLPLGASQAVVGSAERARQRAPLEQLAELIVNLVGAAVAKPGHSASRFTATTALPSAIDAVARATLAAARDGVQSVADAVARALGPMLLEARRLGSPIGADTLQAVADIANAAGSVGRDELFEALLLDAIANSLVAGNNFESAARLVKWTERAVCALRDARLVARTPVAPSVRALLLANKETTDALHTWLARCGASAGTAAAAVLRSFCC